MHLVSVRESSLFDVVDHTPYFSLYKKEANISESAIQIFYVLPGIEMVFRDIREMKGYCNPDTVITRRNLLHIDHCSLGRAELRMSDEHITLLGQGCVFVGLHKGYQGPLKYPIGRFKGISVIVDLDLAQESIRLLAPTYPIDFSLIKERLFKHGSCHSIRADNDIVGLLCGLYTVPEKSKYALSQLKTLELLIYLNEYALNYEKENRALEPHQVRIALAAQKALTDNLAYQYSIEELAKTFHVSKTSLKKYFKEVFGAPIATYAREYRIEKAMILLTQTDQKIANIALAVGFQSQSKFASAFKAKTGQSPQKFRISMRNTSN